MRVSYQRVTRSFIHHLLIMATCITASLTTYTNSTLHASVNEVHLLSDYQKPAYLIDAIDLTFTLHDTTTRVKSVMNVRRNSSDSLEPLVLDGENLKLHSVKVNDRLITKEDYTRDSKSLTIHQLPDTSTIEIVTIINPSANTALDGLYKSGKMFCTQNEPQGFRNITYFLDRPDVLARYHCTIIADKEKYPVLLSNGNLVFSGSLNNGRHFASWEDPFPKPSYLFALVAGDLSHIEDQFTTQSGREIPLYIYCTAGNEERCRHAMTSLKKAMRWDEEVYGLEYDLDIFMIVAVDNFNSGAMENKGLNIFNTACILAGSETETDANFEQVEGVIAHEYFHNWTGNRVTCRDWFQLTLKEGLTVFRDHEFSSDMNSRPVTRIHQAAYLKQNQYPEDAGPTAHSIRPESFMEVNNLYTSTVYEKGQEVIRMIQTIIGKDSFRKGIDKYFELYDGQAVTTENFVYAMETASGKDLSQFKRWYEQAGTPRVSIQENYDSQKQEYSIKISQNTPATADGTAKDAFHFPLAIGFLASDGSEMNLGHDALREVDGLKFLEIRKSEETFSFTGVQSKPTLSLNRNFSAPILTLLERSNDELLFLLANDTDAYARWEAGQEIYSRYILHGMDDSSLDKILTAIESIMHNNQIENALKAKLIELPTDALLAQQQEILDYESISQAKKSLTEALKSRFQNEFLAIYQSLNLVKDYAFNTEDVGDRALKNFCLGYITDPSIPSEQFAVANNMTDRIHALRLLEGNDRVNALDRFYEQANGDSLVLMKWFSLQAQSTEAGTLDEVIRLYTHPAMNLGNPNLVRSLFVPFIRNGLHFHEETGRGYKFLADVILEMDKTNPQMASGLAKGFRDYKKLDSDRKEQMKTELERILNHKTLSSNVYEIISKTMNS
jgi:aminopeptidase N